MRMCFLVIVLGLLLPPLGASATTATPAPDLTVTIHDAQGAAVPAAAVQVRDASGVRLLGTATSDANGSASVSRLTLPEVRLVVRGTLPNGTALTQIGTDADGLRLFLQDGPMTVALVVEPDGVVIPDPREFTTDPGVPIGSPQPTVDLAAIPPAPPVARAAAPSGSTAPVRNPWGEVPTRDGTAAAPAAPVAAPPSWLTTLLYTLIALTSIALLVVVGLYVRQRGGRP